MRRGQLSHAATSRTLYLDVIDNTMERIIWVPCAGMNWTNPAVPKNHVGEIRHEKSAGVFEESNTWLSQQEAQEQYPDIILSSSHTRCPDCSAVWRAAAEAYFNSNSS